MITYSVSDFLPLIIIGVLLVFFGAMIGIIIFIKRRTNKIGINEEEKVDEHQAVQQELDRILVPIDDEEVKKEMEKSASDEE